MKYLLMLKNLSNGVIIAGIGVAVLLLFFLFGSLPKGLPTYLIAIAVGGPLIYLGLKSYWQDHEIQRLLQANAFLKMSKRMAVISDIKKSEENGTVKTTFSFIRPVSAGLIAVAAWNVLSISVVNVFSPIRAVIFAVSLTLLFVWKKMSPILLIVLCGVAGVIFL